jgi:hypothetical protein
VVFVSFVREKILLLVSIELKRRLETLKELNMGRCIASYFDVSGAPGYSFCGWSHGKGTFRGSKIYVFGCSSPKAVDGDIQVIVGFLSGWLIDRWMRKD